MKYDFLQSDFSGGEISPRAQGHVDSEAYRHGLSRAANCAPTRGGSIASRAGLKAKLDGVDAHTGAASNLPVQHIDVHDGPNGDFVIEVSPTGLRMLDKNGLIPTNFPPSASFLQFTVQDGKFAYGDAAEGAVYLRSEVATGVRSYYLTLGSGAFNAIISAAYFNTPLTTNDSWTLSGKVAGDGLTLRVGATNPANNQDFALNPDANGNFSITFTPALAGSDPFYLRLLTGAGTATTVLWDLNLTKNKATTVIDTSAVVAVAAFNGVNVAPSQERVRAAAFWAQGDFWVAFAGGPGNAYAGFALRYHPDAGTLLTGWTFGTLPCTPSSLAQITGANAVAVFQDRLWYGINLANGKKVIRASVIGFGRPWSLAPQAGSTGNPLPKGVNWLFQFIVETETFVVGVGPTTFFTYHFPSANPKAELIVYVANQLRAESADYVPAGHEYDYLARPDNGSRVADQTVVPGGDINFRNAPTPPPTGTTVADVVTITRVALAEDPLDLNLASPAGKIAWLNVLRGLILGTSRNEKLFQQDIALTIDPSTGQSFNVLDESSHGADPALMALDINDRVLFAQRGRKILRMAGISITSDGGLVSEDVGVAGEHLTKLKIRSMCFLKSPVQRAVFAFDDGTGAVMTLVGKGVAFSRFTIPACYGGIYSVAALNGPDDSELWVGTENGATLWARTFESDILVKQISLPAAAPAAPAHFTYDTESPLPPVMDGWARLPLVNSGGAQYVTVPSAILEGATVYALIRGQVQGPYVVTGGRVTLTTLGLDATWVTELGERRATEVYVGVAFPEHRWTSLPLEGGNPAGTSQGKPSRKPQLYLRLVDSYMPKVNGTRGAERGPADKMDLLGSRVTGDRRATELNFQRGAVVDVVMDTPLRMEVSAIFGGTAMNGI